MKQPALDRPADQAIGTPSEPLDWRHPLWLGLLVGASMVFSLGLACAVPLAAFAAAAALSLSRRDALLLILLVWAGEPARRFHLARLIPGPRAPLPGEWRWASWPSLRPWPVSGWPDASVNARHAVTFAATFLIAFAVYEAALFAISATLLGGTEIYTAAIQGRIFAINAAAFVGLLVLNHLAASVGLVNRPATTLAMTERHA